MVWWGSERSGFRGDDKSFLSKEVRKIVWSSRNSMYKDIEVRINLCVVKEMLLFSGFLRISL